MRLSLIVPCFNEQDNIFPFARAVAEVFPDPSDYEIVFVNDGSKDKTLQNLKELHRQSRQNISGGQLLPQLWQGERHLCRAATLRRRVYQLD